MNQKSNRMCNIAMGSALIVLSVIFIVYTTVNLEIRNAETIIAAGTFPVILSAALLLCGIMIIREQMKATPAEGADEPPVFEKEDTVYAIKVVLLLMGSIPLISLVGYLAAMATFSYVFMTFIARDRKGFLYRAACSLVLPGVMYYSFKSLNLMLPAPFWL